MKHSTILTFAGLLFISSLHAGTSDTTSNDIATAASSPSWYANREWNVSLWGSYAFTQHDYPTLQNAFRTFLLPATDPSHAVVPDHDRYLETDHAWGGGIDAKFFFTRYFAVGVEGYVLGARQSFPDVNVNFFGGPGIERTGHDRQLIGAGLGTFTVRYPIGPSHFAPYIFIGGGAIFGGGQPSRIIAPPDAELSIRDDGGQTELVGQAGGGLEVRLTPHIGIISDFTWNFVEGRRNDFGMVRAGINFAF